MRSFTAAKPLIVSQVRTPPPVSVPGNHYFFNSQPLICKKASFFGSMWLRTNYQKTISMSRTKCGFFFFDENLNKSEEKMQAFTKNHVLIKTAAADRDENAIFPWKRLGRRNVDLFENYSLFTKKNVGIIYERRHLLNRNSICIILSIWLLTYDDERRKSTSDDDVVIVDKCPLRRQLITASILLLRKHWSGIQ